MAGRAAAHEHARRSYREKSAIGRRYHSEHALRIDLGSDTYFRAFGLIGHNLSQAATIRLELGNDSTFAATNYDSTALALNTVIYPPGVLITGDPGESDDKLPASEYALGYPLDHYHIFNSNGRYARILLSDAANADGYVEFGRLWLSWGWQPTINMQTGLEIRWETSRTRSETDGGVAFHNERPRRRFVNLSLSNADEDEALVRSFELNRRQARTTRSSSSTIRTTRSTCIDAPSSGPCGL